MELPPLPVHEPPRTDYKQAEPVQLPPLDGPPYHVTQGPVPDQQLNHMRQIQMQMAEAAQELQRTYQESRTDVDAEEGGARDALVSDEEWNWRNIYNMVQSVLPHHRHDNDNTNHNNNTFQPPPKAAPPPHGYYAPQPPPRRASPVSSSLMTRAVDDSWLYGPVPTRVQLAVELLQSQETATRRDIEADEEVNFQRVWWKYSSFVDVLHLDEQYEKAYNAEQGRAKREADERLSLDEQQAKDILNSLHVRTPPKAAAPPPRPQYAPPAAYRHAVAHRKLTETEYWEASWALQRQEKALRELLVQEENELWAGLMEEFGAKEFRLAAMAIQRGWRCHAARTKASQLRAERYPARPQYHPFVPAEQVPPPHLHHYYVQQNVPRPPPPHVHHSFQQAPRPTHMIDDNARARRLERIKHEIWDLPRERRTELVKFTRHTFPRAMMELPPDQSVPGKVKSQTTLNIYTLTDAELDVFEAFLNGRRVQSSVEYQHTVGYQQSPRAPAPPEYLPEQPSSSTARRAMEVRRSVELDESATAKRELLAQRIRALMPDSQRVLTVHLRATAPWTLKQVENTHVVDTKDMDDDAYQHTHILVLELLQAERDRGETVQEYYRRERLRLGKEREELALKREQEEEETLRWKREVMDREWLEERRKRDQDERKLLLRMREMEEVDRGRRKTDLERIEFEERLRWEEEEFRRAENTRRYENEQRATARRKLEVAEEGRLEAMRLRDAEDREYQRRARELDERERELDLQTRRTEEEDRRFLPLDRQKLAEDVASLDAGRRQKLARFVEALDPACVQSGKLIPGRVSAGAMPFIVTYCTQLKLEQESDAPQHYAIDLRQAPPQGQVQAAPLPPPPPAMHSQSPRPAYQRDPPTRPGGEMEPSVPDADIAPADSASNRGDAAAVHSTRASQQQRDWPADGSPPSPIPQQAPVVTTEDREKLPQSMLDLSEVSVRTLVKRLKETCPHALERQDHQTAIDTAKLTDWEFLELKSFVTQLQREDAAREAAVH